MLAYLQPPASPYHPQFLSGSYRQSSQQGDKVGIPLVHGEEKLWEPDRRLSSPSWDGVRGELAGGGSHCPRVRSSSSLVSPRPSSSRVTSCEPMELIIIANFQPRPDLQKQKPWGGASLLSIKPSRGV